MHHLYELDWSHVDADKVSRAADTVAKEVGGKAKLQAVDDGDLEVYLTVPIGQIRPRESGEFDLRLLKEQLSRASSLTLLASFRLHPRGNEVQLTVEGEEANNELCDRTAAHVAKRLCELLGARLRN